MSNTKMVPAGNAGGSGRRRCDGLVRRDFLRIGGLSAFGLGLTDLLRLRARADIHTPPRARSCILIWLDGGPSHLETFDLKPDAPAEVRGPFQPIPTSVPGIQICELLPETAQRMQHIALVRSVTSTLGEHNFGAHYLMTGYRPTPALPYPCFGSVVTHLREPEIDLPPFVAVPGFRVGGGKFKSHGYLPATTAPFEVGGDPGKPDFRVRDLDLFPGITGPRLAQRKSYLAALDRFRGQTEDSSDVPDDPIFEQAYRMLTSESARAAFDIGEESDVTRRRYGPKSVGQSCLLARRLIERGVPFVTVNNPGWDTHQNQYTRLKEGFTGAKIPVGLIPSLDLALSALIQDLVDRGLLDETLIVVMGEFGRTPKLNTGGGRDHWPRAFSVLLAGGGISGGQVVGASDAVGESPADRPVTPADLAATIYTLLGIDPRTKLHTSDGRPVPVVHDGQAIDELIA